MRVKHDTSPSRTRDWSWTAALLGALVTACGGPGGEAPRKAKARAQAKPETKAETKSGTKAAPAEGAKASPPAAKADVALTVQEVGFMTPESALHDPVADLYLVSNIEGGPGDEDGNGFISRVSPDGAVQSLKWIDGFSDGITLNAPKGMAIVGETLYVADIDHVRKFDRRAGTPAGAIKIDGAKFLNDITPALPEDEGAAVYVSDTADNVVYKLGQDDAVAPMVRGEALAGSAAAEAEQEGQSGAFIADR